MAHSLKLCSRLSQNLRQLLGLVGLHGSREMFMMSFYDSSFNPAAPLGASAAPMRASTAPVGASTAPVGASSAPVGASTDPAGASSAPLGPPQLQQEPLQIQQKPPQLRLSLLSSRRSLHRCNRSLLSSNSRRGFRKSRCDSWASLIRFRLNLHSSEVSLCSLGVNIRSPGKSLYGS